MSGRKPNNNPGLCPVKRQHRWWCLTFRIYPLPPILMMEGFFSETLKSPYGVWYCRWLQSVTCCHFYHRQNPPKASVQATVVSKCHTFGDVQVLQLDVPLLVRRQDWPFCWGYGWRRWALKDALIKKYIGMFLLHGYWHVTSAIRHQSTPNVKYKIQSMECK